MNEVVRFLRKDEVFVLIREYLGSSDNEQKYFSRYFKGYGGGFIPIIDLDSFKFFTKEEALELIEKRTGFPNPSVRYLEEYFFCENNRYIPRVNFTRLRKNVEKKQLVTALSQVMNLPFTDQRRQAVMIEIMNTIKKCQIDYVESNLQNN